MRITTFKRVMYFGMAAIFLGIAGYQWAQSGLTSDTYVAGGFGLLMAIMGATASAG